MVRVAECPDGKRIQGLFSQEFAGSNPVSQSSSTTDFASAAKQSA
ncbi:hypothetical protein ASZ90_009485 [hydrocarbon metagenome]|uniref:Uncharacterized protein n=1 Tax=hydrocarbon metagenome TaxID=938273 RepID=A0A0W8FIR3_9ZZZZ